MRRLLLSRIQALEGKAAAVATVPSCVRYGWINRLPDDYQGERHLVAVNCQPSDSAPFQWCQSRNGQVLRQSAIALDELARPMGDFL
jgi:hypothetical protein